MSKNAPLKKKRSKPKRRRLADTIQTPAGKGAKPTKPLKPVVDKPQPETDRNIPSGSWYAALIVSVATFLWAYLPVINSLIQQWSTVPDYTHGFIVAPIAAYLYWAAQKNVSANALRISMAGLTVIFAAALIRTIGAFYYLEALQGWSIPIWVAGLIWTFLGWEVFLASLPAVGFLVFMVPLPYSVEYMLSSPLQQISTKISLFAIQCIGLSAVSEGTTILMGDHQLEVERACSGIRIFFGIAALAYAFMILYRRPFWFAVIIAVAVLPITLIANSARIVTTAMLLTMGWGETADQLTHDFAGLFMIPFAALLFVLTLKYLDSLFPIVENVNAEVLVQNRVNSSS